MKRKLFLYLCICTLLCLSLALCGSDLPDGNNIQIEEDDFVEINMDAPDSLNYLESIYSLRAVNSMLGHEGEEGYAELLYNGNDQAEYILATAEEGGYAIFHRMTGSLIEMGEFGVSAYNGQSGRKYYFGPSNYAVTGADNALHDIMRESVISAEDRQAMHRYMAEKRATMVERSETKTYSAMLTNLQTTNTAELQAENGGGVEMRNIVDDYWENNPFDDEVNIDSFTEIEHSEFYKNMKSADDFGDNTEGSCIFVTTVLMLRYFDQYYAPSLIPNKNIPQAWRDACFGENMNSSTAEIDAYDCTIETGDSVYEALHKYLITLSWEIAFPALSGYNVEAYSNTLPSCTKIENDFSVKTEANVFSVAKINIDSNKPVAVGICYSFNGEVGSHSIVVYGYYDGVGNNDYLKAHFGWDTTEDCSSIIVPLDYVDGGINTMTITVNDHETYGAHMCNRYGSTTTACFAKEGHQIYQASDFSHQCGCGMYGTHSGIGIMDAWEDYALTGSLTADAEECAKQLLLTKCDENGHFAACAECMKAITGKTYQELTTGWMDQYFELMADYPADEELEYPGFVNIWAPHTAGTGLDSNDDTCNKICVYCNYVIDANYHGAYTYTNLGAVGHRKTCLCGDDSGREDHMLQAQGLKVVCMYCGYVSTGDGPLIPIPPLGLL